MEFTHLAKALAAQQNPVAAKKTPLTYNQWEIAYRLWSTAAAINGMLDYPSAMAHMVDMLAAIVLCLCCFAWIQVNCQMIAEQANVRNNRRRWLAILYDEASHLQQNCHVLAHAVSAFRKCVVFGTSAPMQEMSHWTSGKQGLRNC